MQAKPSNHWSNNIESQLNFPVTWTALISSSLTTLRRLAGATEDEFLQIGRQMQGIYQRSITFSLTAHRPVEVASGERISISMDRLHQFLQELDTSLEQVQVRTLIGCATLEKVKTRLQQVVEPLVAVSHCHYLPIAERRYQPGQNSGGARCGNTAHSSDTLTLAPTKR